MMQRNPRFILGMILWTLCVTESQALSVIPRFVSLRANTVNFRIGPGSEYPTKWVYLRLQLPVKVIKEHENWRFVEDYEGIKGWVHQRLLSGLRTVMIVGEHLILLRQKPDSQAPALAKAEHGLIGMLIKTQKNWCQIRINRTLYWVPRAHVWGVLEDE